MYLYVWPDRIGLISDAQRVLAMNVLTFLCTNWSKTHWAVTYIDIFSSLTTINQETSGLSIATDVPA